MKSYHSTTPMQSRQSKYHQPSMQTYWQIRTLPAVEDPELVDIDDELLDDEENDRD